MIRLLLVGDNAIVACEIEENICTDLKYHNNRVTDEAVNSAEVLPHLKEENFDLSLLDMDMPDEISINLIKSIRTYSPALPVVILLMPDQA